MNNIHDLLLAHYTPVHMHENSMCRRTTSLLNFCRFASRGRYIPSVFGPLLNCVQCDAMSDDCMFCSFKSFLCVGFWIRKREEIYCQYESMIVVSLLPLLFLVVSAVTSSSFELWMRVLLMNGNYNYSIWPPTLLQSPVLGKEMWKRPPQLFWWYSTLDCSLMAAMNRTTNEIQLGIRTLIQNIVLFFWIVCGVLAMKCMQSSVIMSLIKSLTVLVLEWMERIK